MQRRNCCLRRIPNRSVREAVEAALAAREGAPVVEQVAPVVRAEAAAARVEPVELEAQGEAKAALAAARVAVLVEEREELAERERVLRSTRMRSTIRLRALNHVRFFRRCRKRVRPISKFFRRWPTGPAGSRFTTRMICSEDYRESRMSKMSFICSATFRRIQRKELATL